MAYKLGNLILPNPIGFKREYIESAVDTMTLEGTSNRKVTNRKERFILNYENLSQARANQILSEYELEQIRTFTVNETNLTIGPTDVLIDIPLREYSKRDRDYIADMVIILTEVN